MGAGKTVMMTALAVLLAAELVGPAVASGGHTLGVGGQVGLFGLVNVDGELTHAEPTFAVSPAWDVALSDIAAIGAEVMVGLARSEVGTDHHLLVSPMFRARLHFPVADAVDVELVAGLGLTWWAGTDAESALHPALSEPRFGWSFRAAAGTAFELSARWSLTLDLGYFASSTWTDDLPITLDGFMATIGPRVRL